VGEVQLEVPARAEYVGLARIVVSNLVSGRRVVDEEMLDDLALAVSEACTLAIGPDASSIVVTVSEDDEAVLVDVRGGSVGPPLPPDAPDPLQLMRALVDDVEVSDGQVRLRMKCRPLSVTAR
jgi:hypothetical protein